MKSSDTQLQQMFVRATDEVIPPAPWLEAHIADALQRRSRARGRWIGLGALQGLRPGLRLAAGLVAILIAVSAVVALLMSARLLNSTVPGARSTSVPTSTPPFSVPFTPSPAVKDPKWPAGGPVPAQLAGAWQRTPSDPILYMAAYTFQLGLEIPDPVSRDGTIGPILYGNVVVNGSELVFMADLGCIFSNKSGFESFTYTLSGDTLVITRTAAPGQLNCGWPKLEGTYTGVSTP